MAHHRVRPGVHPMLCVLRALPLAAGLDGLGHGAAPATEPVRLAAAAHTGNLCKPAASWVHAQSTQKPFKQGLQRSGTRLKHLVPLAEGSGMPCNGQLGHGQLWHEGAQVLRLWVLSRQELLQPVSVHIHRQLPRGAFLPQQVRGEVRCARDRCHCWSCACASLLKHGKHVLSGVLSSENYKRLDRSGGCTIVAGQSFISHLIGQILQLERLEPPQVRVFLVNQHLAV